MALTYVLMGEQWEIVVHTFFCQMYVAGWELQRHISWLTL